MSENFIFVQKQVEDLLDNRHSYLSSTDGYKTWYKILRGAVRITVTDLGAMNLVEIKFNGCNYNNDTIYWSDSATFELGNPGISDYLTKQLQKAVEWHNTNEEMQGKIQELRKWCAAKEINMNVCFWNYSHSDRGHVVSEIFLV